MIDIYMPASCTYNVIIMLMNIYHAAMCLSFFLCVGTTTEHQHQEKNFVVVVVFWLCHEIILETGAFPPRFFREIMC